jgi:hypothetical protein
LARNDLREIADVADRPPGEMRPTLSVSSLIAINAEGRILTIFGHPGKSDYVLCPVLT